VHVDCKGDTYWITTMQINRGMPRKTWWDRVRQDVKRFGLSSQDVLYRTGTNGEGKLGQLANPGSPEHGC